MWTAHSTLIDFHQLVHIVVVVVDGRSFARSCVPFHTSSAFKSQLQLLICSLIPYTHAFYLRRVSFVVCIAFVSVSSENSNAIIIKLYQCRKRVREAANVDMEEENHLFHALCMLENEHDDEKNPSKRSCFECVRERERGGREHRKANYSLGLINTTITHTTIPIDSSIISQHRCRVSDIYFRIYAFVCKC